jgi:hypothetical protein
MIGSRRSKTPPWSLVILSIVLAASFRVSSAVRVRLCKSMELRHVPRERHLACIRPAIALQSSHHSRPTPTSKARRPGQHTRTPPSINHWTVSCRLISSDRCLFVTARTHCASLDPATVELRRSAQTHFCCQQAPPSRQTPQHALRTSRRVTISSLNCNIPLTARLQ